MDSKMTKIRECLAKHKQITAYLPYSKYSLEEFREFFEKLDKDTGSLCSFLCTEGWFNEVADAVSQLTLKYNTYFMETDIKGIFKNNEAVSVENSKRLLKILMLCSCELNDSATINYRAELFYEFYQFFSKLMDEDNILLLVSFMNQVFSMIQEYTGMMIQYFLCIPNSEKDVYTILRHIDGQIPFCFQFCDYYISDYLVLFDKSFNYLINSNSVLIHREMVFNKLFELITGQKIDYSSENYDMRSNIKYDSSKVIDVKCLASILQEMPEIYSPLRLCYVYLTGEFISKELINSQQLENIFNVL